MPERRHSGIATMPSRRRSSESDGGTAASLGAADWLSLAAAPTFAAMALLAGSPGDNMTGMSGSAAPLSDMTLMYLLMSAFHSAPWLRLISGR